MESETLPSPFLHPGWHARESSLAILHLKRDHLLPTLLLDTAEESTGYAEGNVTNTRFGSFPHSTLIGQPWGSQVLASKVDTGSRGRKDASVAAGTKRKIEAVVEDNTAAVSPKGPKQASTAAVTASSGFCHILPPTPEAWTISLPHRTQVVYTPDYSYILQKLGVQPGSVVIEAGAGSGSFTHAAARAVYNGQLAPELAASRRPTGRVYSFEYHQPRVEQLRNELEEHGLSSIVKATHRDVYAEGFLIADPVAGESDVPASPMATHIFLDLPAPWQALPNLARDMSPSPLDPTQAVHLCAFLPCIEQVTRTIATLRSHGWLEITMQELMHRRIDVRRERIGLELEGQRGVNSMPATVDEAVERLLEVEEAEKRYRERGNAMEQAKLLAAAADMAPSLAAQSGANGDTEVGDTMRDEEVKRADEAEVCDNNYANNSNGDAVTADDSDADGEARAGKGEEEGRAARGGRDDDNNNRSGSKAARLARLAAQAAARQKRVYKEGRLVHRTEPELKTHTSYLVFATSPRPWSEQDEAAARARWPVSAATAPTGTGEAAKKSGKDALNKKRQKGKKHNDE